MTSDNPSSNAALVLLADDLPEVLRVWTTVLTEHDVSYVTASTLEELDRMFNRHRDDISAIILDGCMPGDDLNTVGFIQSARASGFQKPIIAASSSRVYRNEMVAAGCSHQARKQDAADMAAMLST